MVFTPPKVPRETIRLPEAASKWSQHEIKSWCREKLCGAPPALPIDPEVNKPLGNWSEVHTYAGQRLRLETNFKGLILNGKFELAHTPPMSSKGSRRIREDSIIENIADASKISSLESTMRTFWARIDSLVDWYNQVDMKSHLRPSGMMWRAGKEMHDIKYEANSGFDFEIVTDDNMRYSVKAWGVGHPKNGYGETQLEQCLKLYHWLPDADESHPILQHRTTPIMKLIRAESKDSDRRMNLFNAYDSGPLKGLSDKQLDWALGLSEGSFPHPSRWDELRELCDTIADGGSLSNDQTSILTSILSEAFSSTGDVG